ncbi:hypothetical protein GCM10023100_01610 [Actinocorallia cavernae]|uniref:Uncharacterized protein n=2 Tax=Actinomycetes TaxID=1760 RepID=A0ABP8S8D1_9ACTN
MAAPPQVRRDRGESPERLMGTVWKPVPRARVSTPMGSQSPTAVCELPVPLTASNAVLEQSQAGGRRTFGGPALPPPDRTPARPRKIASHRLQGPPQPGLGKNCASH